MILPERRVLEQQIFKHSNDGNDKDNHKVSKNLIYATFNYILMYVLLRLNNVQEQNQDSGKQFIFANVTACFVMISQSGCIIANLSNRKHLHCKNKVFLIFF